MSKPVVVIGGGPAGVTAALRARERGLDVMLLEATPRLLNKLRISGKGRCNLTNAAERQEFLSQIVHGGRFFQSAFCAFDNHALMAWVESLGVPLKVERGQRVFPQSDRAHDVADALTQALGDAGVKYGLQRATAYRLAAKMVEGVGALYLANETHPGAMKDAVCSPGGTTIKGVASLEESAFRGAVIKAVDAIEA